VAKKLPTTPAELPRVRSLEKRVRKAMLQPGQPGAPSRTERTHVKYGPDVHYGVGSHGSHFGVREGRHPVHLYPDHMYIGDRKSGVEASLNEGQKKRVRQLFLERAEKIGGAKKASTPNILFHGSPQDLSELKAPDKKTGIFLTSQPGLAAPFIVGREQLSGKHGKLRIGQHTWETLKPDDMAIPREIVIRHSGKATKGKGQSKGFIYAVDASKLKDRLKISPDEPREMIFHGETLPIIGKVPATIRWRTEQARLDSRKTTKQGSVLNPFVSKEKQRALLRTDALFAQDNDTRWDDFLGNSKRKSFVKAVQNDPRTDDKLKRHVDQMNRLLMGRVIATVPGSTGNPYNIIRLRGGRGELGCTCPDWRYKKSVAPVGEQDCRHIKRHREKGLNR